MEKNSECDIGEYATIPPSKLHRIELTQTQNLFFNFAGCLSDLPASSKSVFAMALILNISIAMIHQFSQYLDTTSSQGRLTICSALLWFKQRPWVSASLY